MLGNNLVQTTLDAMATNIAVLQGDGRILGVNAAWKQFGIGHAFDPRSCGVGANYLAICDAVQGEDAECAQAVACAIRDLAAGFSDQFVMQYSSETPEGITEWWVVRISRYPSDKSVRIVVSHEDITGFKGDADTLGSAEWLRQMIHALPIGAAFVSGDEIHVNAALERTTGLGVAGGLSPSEWLTALHGDRSSPLAELLNAERYSGLQEAHELPLLHRDGTPRWVQFRAMPCREGELWLFHDLTEFKQMQIALGENEERNRRIVEAMPVGVIEITARGRVHHANARAREILGRIHWDADHSGPDDWFQDARRPDGSRLEDGEDPVRACRESVQDARPQTLELVGPDGDVVWAVCAAVHDGSADDEDGSPILLTLQEVQPSEVPNVTGEKASTTKD